MGDNQRCEIVLVLTDCMAVAERANAAEKQGRKRRRDNAEEAEDTFLPVSNIARVVEAPWWLLADMMA